MHSRISAGGYQRHCACTDAADFQRAFAPFAPVRPSASEAPVRTQHWFFASGAPHFCIDEVSARTGQRHCERKALTRTFPIPCRWQSRSPVRGLRPSNSCYSLSARPAYTSDNYAARCWGIYPTQVARRVAFHRALGCREVLRSTRRVPGASDALRRGTTIGGTVGRFVLVACLGARIATPVVWRDCAQH